MILTAILFSFSIAINGYIYHMKPFASVHHKIFSYSHNMFEASILHPRGSHLSQRQEKSAMRRYIRPLDDDIDPLTEFDNSNNPKWYPLAELENASIEDKMIAETINGRIEKLYNLLGTTKSSSKSKITKELFVEWEIEARSIASDIRLLKSGKQAVLAAYKQLIAVSAPITLDPLHLATFDLISRAVIDNLVKVRKNAPVTEIVDDLTDIHLDYIEPFRSVIDDGGSDGYSQSARQEFLCYQYAAIVKRTYIQLTRSLGSDFDSSISMQNMRIENWIAPIHARLQRRFVRFTSSDVDDKIEELLQQAFDRLLAAVSIDVSIRYTLRSFDASQPKISPIKSYPAWDQADTIIKILRNTVVGYDTLTTSLESKLLRTAQSDISSQMRPLGRTLELTLEKPFAKELLLQPKEIKAVEDMLNIGHSVVTTTYTFWHIRHNIAGVPGGDGVMIKDYIQPVVLESKETLAESLPKYLRADIFAYVKDLTKRIKPSEYLEAAAILAHAVRDTASEYLRALIIFNADSTDWPSSRDACYQSVLTAVLYDALLVSDIDEKGFYQNLIAIAALEEAMGVREPRASCREAFRIALRNTATMLLANDQISKRPDLTARIKFVDDAISMTLRLPEGSSRVLKFQAFQDVISGILSEYEGRSGGLKEVQRVYPWIAAYLGVDEKVAKSYIDPLAQEKFDKAIGSILMSADLASSMPKSMGDTLRDQIYSLADQVSMTREQATSRVSLLSGAVFESIMETALEESRRSNFDRVEILFKKAYNMYRHPLLLGLETMKGAPSKNLRSVGVKMVFDRLGKNLAVELLRLVESTKQRLSSDGPQAEGGWGNSASNVQQKVDPGLLTFLVDLQQDLLQQYTTASIGSEL